MSKLTKARKGKMLKFIYQLEGNKK